jgi:AraC family transcriptional regulator, transcriptional activator of pobA
MEKVKLVEFSFWGADIDIETNFGIQISHNRLPLSNLPLRVSECFVCVFKRGRLELVINSKHYHLQEGMILSIFPAQVVEEVACSDDLELMYFRCSQEIFNRVLFRFPPEFELYLKEYPTFKLPVSIFQKYSELITLMNQKIAEKNNICRNEIILSLLRCFFLEIYNNMHHELIENPVKNTRPKELARTFQELIIQYYKENRDVAFYADKLHITPKYLSIVSEKINGRNAKRTIDEYTITEIKLMLKTTTQSLIEITEELNFPDVSFFCKYFKNLTQTTPRQYRYDIKKR